jgi:hypothetical protein
MEVLYNFYQENMQGDSEQQPKNQSNPSVSCP